MPIEHKVKQGEQFASIANKYGFKDWHTIYEHADNRELREKRPNPNVLHPGDIVTIPDKELKSFDGSTETRHRFRQLGGHLLLRLVVRRYGHPIVDKRYELRIGESVSPAVYEGRTDSEGLVKQTIRTDATRGELIVWNDDEDPPKKIFSRILNIGHLDPVEDITGVQARLRNLGYYHGAVDNDNGPETQAAVMAFQEKQGLEINGVIGDETRQKLLDEHGS